ncbi:hypothetical protein [Halobacterium salinarum]|nr:hypothetical protein [Halobacterium salinarum]
MQSSVSPMCPPADCADEMRRDGLLSTRRLFAPGCPRASGHADAP